MWKDACIFRSNYKTAEIISNGTVHVIIRQSAKRISSGRQYIWLVGCNSCIDTNCYVLRRWRHQVLPKRFQISTRLHGVTIQVAVCISSQWLNTTLTRGAQIPGTKFPGPLNLCRRRLIFVELASCHPSGAYDIGKYVHLLRWRSRLRHCAASRKVAGSIPDGVTGILHGHKPSGPGVAVALNSTSKKNGFPRIFLGGGGVKAAGA